MRQISELRLGGGRLHWLESGSGGPATTRIMRLSTRAIVEAVTGPNVDVGDRVHEYRGGAYSLHDGMLFYSDRSDGRICRHDAGESSPVTAPGADRFADWIHDTVRNRLISVREQSQSASDPTNTLVAVDLSTGAIGEPLYSRADFVSEPTRRWTAFGGVKTGDRLAPDCPHHQNFLTLWPIVGGPRAKAPRTG